MDNKKALSKQYEEELFKNGYSNIELPQLDLFMFAPEYFLAYNRKYELERIDDLTVRITTKSKMYPAFIYDITRHSAMATIKYIDKEDEQ